MKSDLDQIKNLIDKHSGLLKDKYSVKELGVFGSVARGESTKSSDIDVLVEFSRPIGFFKFVDLEKYLGEILGKKVDLVTKKALKNAIRDEILKEVVYV